MNNIVTTLKEQLQKPRFVIFIFITLCFFVVLLIALFSTSSPKIGVYATGLSEEMIGTYDDNLVIYNGLSFYQVNPISESGFKILYTPNYRLPVPSRIVWSNTGVLLNFDRGVNLTPIENKLVESGAAYSPSINYMTWYLDFEDGSLSLVDELPLGTHPSVYSSSSGGFYYITGEVENLGDDGVNQLKFFDTKTKKMNVTIDNLSFLPISMTNCDTNGGKNVCLVGATAYNKNSIQSISKTGNIKELVNEKGRIVPSSTESVFVLLGDSKIYNDTDLVYNKISLFDVSTEKTKRVNFSGKVADNSLVFSQLSDLHIFLDGKDDKYATLKRGWFGNNTLEWSALNLKPSGNTKELPDISSGFIVYEEKPSRNFILMSSLSRKTYLLSKDRVLQDLSRLNKDSIIKSVGSCISKPISDQVEVIDNSITIYLEEENMLDQLPDIKKCIAKDRKNLPGYFYEFRGVSSESGRISTD